MTFFVVVIAIVLLMIAVGAIMQHFDKPAAGAASKHLDADTSSAHAETAISGAADSSRTLKSGTFLARPAKERSPNQKRRLSSPDIVAFSERHGIPLDRFFDAAGMTKAEYAREMESVGAIIAYNVVRCDTQVLLPLIYVKVKQLLALRLGSAALEAAPVTFASAMRRMTCISERVSRPNQ